MSTNSPQAQPSNNDTAAPVRKRRVRPAVLGLLILGGLAVGVGVTFAINAYIANVEGGLAPPKEFERLNRTPAPEPAPAPAPEPPTNPAPAPTGSTPAPTGPT